MRKNNNSKKKEVKDEKMNIETQVNQIIIGGKQVSIHTLRK